MDEGNYLLIIIAILFVLSTISEAIKKSSQKKKPPQPPPEEDDENITVYDAETELGKDKMLEEIRGWLEGHPPTGDEKKDNVKVTQPNRGLKPVPIPSRPIPQRTKPVVITAPAPSRPPYTYTPAEPVKPATVRYRESPRVVSHPVTTEMDEFPPVTPRPQRLLKGKLPPRRSKRAVCSYESILADRPFLQRVIIMNEVIGTPLALKKLREGKVTGRRR